mgnify:CR=1 FL=1
MQRNPGLCFSSKLFGQASCVQTACAHSSDAVISFLLTADGRSWIFFLCLRLPSAVSFAPFAASNPGGRSVTKLVAVLAAAFRLTISTRFAVTTAALLCSDTYSAR